MKMADITDFFGGLRVLVRYCVHCLGKLEECFLSRLLGIDSLDSFLTCEMMLHDGRISSRHSFMSLLFTLAVSLKKKVFFLRKGKASDPNWKLLHEVIWSG